jgi:hypothetical protein
VLVAGYACSVTCPIVLLCKPDLTNNGALSPLMGREEMTGVPSCTISQPGLLHSVRQDRGCRLIKNPTCHKDKTNTYYIMKQFTFSLVFSLLTFWGFSQAKESADKKEIRQILTTFMDCLVKKDSTRFYALFNEEPVVWVGIFREKTKRAMLKSDSTMPTYFISTYKEFFRGLAPGAAYEEKFYNVDIIEDGSIAAVNFDYSFWENNKKTNWGKESWGLVKINNKWKITNVLFSMDYEQINPEPKNIIKTK